MRNSVLLCLILAGLLLLGCNTPLPTPTPDLVATEVAVQKTAAAILTAEAVAVAPTVATPSPLPPTATPLPADTPSPTATPLPADTPPPTATPLPAITLAPLCTVVSDGRPLRSGPGTVYDLLGTLPLNTPLTPLAFSAVGYPEGQWLQVQTSGNQLGWVIVGESYLSCNLDPTTLPSTLIPPTPTAAPTSTPLPIPATPTPTREALAVMADPEGGGGNYIDGTLIFPSLPPGFIDTSYPLIFKGRLVFRVEAYDIRYGTNDSTGIEKVDIRLTYLDEDEGEIEVHRNSEVNPSYCVFGGNEPTCQPWVFAEHGQRWPEGQPIKNGDYRADITIVPRDKTPDENGDVEANWLFNFKIEGQPSFEASNLVAEIEQIGPGALDSFVNDALVFQVRATAGHNDGDGIANVDLRIIGPSGQVYQRTENDPHYCAFGGGEPNCNIWVFAEHSYTWPNGQPIEPGTHILRATVNASNGQSTMVETTVEIQP